MRAGEETKGGRQIRHYAIEAASSVGGAALLVQLLEPLDGLRVVFLRGGNQQDTRLIAILRNAVAAEIEIGKRHFRARVALLDRSPQTLRRHFAGLRLIDGARRRPQIIYRARQI